MKYTFWVITNRVGSKCEWTIDVDDEDLEGRTEEEKEAYLYELYQETAGNFIEFGWKPEEESED